MNFNDQASLEFLRIYSEYPPQPKLRFQSQSCNVVCNLRRGEKKVACRWHDCGSSSAIGADLRRSIVRLGV
jgi:hypothetical protein